MQVFLVKTVLRDRNNVFHGFTDLPEKSFRNSSNSIGRSEGIISFENAIKKSLVNTL